MGKRKNRPTPAWSWHRPGNRPGGAQLDPDRVLKILAARRDPIARPAASEAKGANR